MEEWHQRSPAAAEDDAIGLRLLLQATVLRLSMRDEQSAPNTRSIAARQQPAGRPKARPASAGLGTPVLSPFAAAASATKASGDGVRLRWQTPCGPRNGTAAQRPCKARPRDPGRWAVG
ncbi:hypothetical protein CDD83_9384 [Cordyceps sp. RAO-2017]|nr:hypothetical protein CDD83_9384 [Cordyceps sp. RAO-2017]